MIWPVYILYTACLYLDMDLCIGIIITYDSLRDMNHVISIANINKIASILTTCFNQAALIIHQSSATVALIPGKKAAIGGQFHLTTNIRSISCIFITGGIAVSQG